MPNKPSDQSSRSNLKEDPLWDLLGKASECTPSNSFARDIVRTARNLPVKLGFMARMKGFFLPRVSTGKFALITVAACAGILVTLQVTPDKADTPLADSVATQADEPAEISEIIFQETLIAAAADPTIFTHDEVLAMVGF